MTRQDVDWLAAWPATVRALNGPGALLVVADERLGANAMTIGWATLGPIWGRKILVTLVRPSRYTYPLLEQVGDFTVNVLPAERVEDLAFCGSRSGRDTDKLAECALTAVPARQTKSPALDEAVIVYECRVLHKHDLDPSVIDPGVARGCYAGGDYHRLYSGEIVACYADPAAL